ncbi:CDP-diacylglycerol--glycerol-3-phosphate 3-phosphatidyltransferase [hydrothermal vent metagenome]|uniref:CDP-diacylglycerol--glycerol-3-phosphate 3-phosphatidyltransferase n=1 Tax=hydrothermal vent metagenome TaxID=652676 RepID=A0A1W1CTF3_9ZZZZ
MNFSQLPNILTITRIILTLPIVFYLLKQQYLLALVLILIAGVSDGLDGWIAKRFGYQSRLGSILDPLADKILLVGCYISLFIISLVPWWLLIAVVLRDVLIMAGSVGFVYALERKSNDLLEPSYLSKANTFLQISLVLFLIITQLFMIEESWILGGLVVVMTSTILSGVDYAWCWLHKFIEIERK